MNALLSLRSIRWLMLLVIGLGCLPVFAVSAFAAAPCVDTAAAMPALQANFLFELVADRTRLIQVSLVIVAFGCAILWWYR
jgi:hypothetical protein